MEEGLPIDDMFFNEDALRMGRSVVVILADTSEQADAARGFMELGGAENIDAAREDWWLGLRDDGEVHYAPYARNLELGESTYRSLSDDFNRATRVRRHSS